MHRTPTTSAHAGRPPDGLPDPARSAAAPGAGQAVPALGAAARLHGGPQAGDYPLYVSNDHTVYALRFSAAAGTLLDAAGTPVTTAGAQYYVKMRISPTAKPSGGTSSGFIWNATTQQWVQERADWSDFPVVTTGAGGAITAGNTWWYFKFGDTTKPGATDSGTWYLLVSLKPIAGADQTTQNNASPPADHHHGHDRRAQPGDAHVGVPHPQRRGATGATRGASRPPTPAGTDVWSLSRTENNQVAQGYGSDATGDFELAVPVGRAFDAKIQNVIWPAWRAASPAPSPTSTSRSAPPTPRRRPRPPRSPPPPATGTCSSPGRPSPTRPRTPSTSGRRRRPSAGPPTTRLSTWRWPPSATTTYDATGLTNGEEYFFEVRANDAATNVGPPTATQAATPKATSHLTLQSSAKTVKWGGRATLTGELTDGAEPFTSGQQVRLEWSYDGSSWTLLQMLDPNAPYAYGVAVQPTRKTVYRLVVRGRRHRTPSTTSPLGRRSSPMVKLGKPHAPVQRQEGQAVHRLRRPHTQSEAPEVTRSRSSATRRSPGPGS